jgi:hypothetical protein
VSDLPAYVVPEDLRPLADLNPGWRFGEDYRQQSSGPGYRILWALNGMVLLSEHSLEGLAEKVRQSGGRGLR